MELYAIFRVEPMHALSPEISEMIKECFIRFLPDPDRTTFSVTTMRNQEKSFLKIQNMVFSSSNVFLKIQKKVDLALVSNLASVKTDFTTIEVVSFSEMVP